MNIALVGFGYWGPNVAKHLFNNKKINLSAICDSNITNLEKAKQIYVSQTSYLSDYNFAIGLDSRQGVFYLDRGILKMEMGNMVAACDDWVKAGNAGYDISSFQYLIDKYCQQ